MSPITAKLVSWGLCFIIGVLATVLFVFAFSALTGPIPIHEACPECTKIDQIKIAASIGRLDIVAIALTVLGIGLGFFAIFSFVAIRSDAREAARSAAKEFGEASMEQLRMETVRSVLEELREDSQPNDNSSLDDTSNSQPIRGL